MAEVFGIVAAATQLAGLSLRLIDLTANIKGATERLSKYQAQLQELHNLSLSISQNPLLQTAEVNDHTQSLLVFVERSSLELLLQKNLWSRTWGFIRRDRYLSQTFNHLEQRKSSLSLLVSDLQSRALYDIRSDLRLISENNIETPISETLFEKPPEPDPLSQVSAPTTVNMGGKSSNTGAKRVSNTASGSEGRREQAEATTSSHNPPQTQVRREIGEEALLSIDENVAKFINNKVNSITSGNIYEGQKGSKVDYQRNGHSNVAWGGDPFPGGSVVYRNNVLKGGRVQYNYSALPVAGPQSEGGSSEPRFNVYTGNEHIIDEGERLNNGEPSVQINGFGLDMEIVKRQLGYRDSADTSKYRG